MANFQPVAHDVLRAEDQVKAEYLGKVLPKPDYDSMVKPVLIQLATKDSRGAVERLLARFGAPRGQDVMQKDLGLMFAMAKQMLANLDDYRETQMRLRVEYARLAAQKAGGTFVPASQVLAQSGKAQEMADALAADAISKGAQQVHDEFIFPAGGTPDSVSNKGEMRDLKSTLSATERFAIEEARNKAVSELFRDVTVKPTPGYVSVKCSPEFFDKVEKAAIDGLFKRIEKLEEKHRKATAWCAAFKYSADDAHRDLQYLREHGTEAKPATQENKPSLIGDIFVDVTKLGEVLSFKCKVSYLDKDALHAALYGTSDPLKKLGIALPTKVQCDVGTDVVTALTGTVAMQEKELETIGANLQEANDEVNRLQTRVAELENTLSNSTYSNSTYAKMVIRHADIEAAWQKKDQEWLAAFTQEQSARIEAERDRDAVKDTLAICIAELDDIKSFAVSKVDYDRVCAELEEFKDALTKRLAELQKAELLYANVLRENNALRSKRKELHDTNNEIREQRDKALKENAELKTRFDTLYNDTAAAVNAAFRARKG